MTFLREFTSNQLAYYEEQLKKGVFIIPKPLGKWREWYILERNQQILFHKIQKLAEVFSLVIPVENPTIPGIVGGWKEWSTLSINQHRLSVALDHLLITISKSFQPSQCSVIIGTHVSNEPAAIVISGIGDLQEFTPQRLAYPQEFTPERLAYYEERLKEGVFIIPKPLGNWREWYILERNQQILFYKIQKLAEAFSLVIHVEEPSVPGIEGCWKEWTTLSTNQQRLSVALDYLLAEDKFLEQPPPCTAIRIQIAACTSHACH